jgi:hypothetical protein
MVPNLGDVRPWEKNQFVMSHSAEILNSLAAFSRLFLKQPSELLTAILTRPSQQISAFTGIVGANRIFHS